MNRYTVSTDFLEYAATEESCDMLLNVLLVFAQDNQYKLCMDRNGLASNEYENVIRTNEKLAFWLEMLNTVPRCIETVNIPKCAYACSQELFLDIANSINPNKRLVTSDKNSFNPWIDFIVNNSISLLDGDEMKALFKPQVNVQISLGNNSPNIIGDNNQTK